MSWLFGINRGSAPAGGGESGQGAAGLSLPSGPGRGGGLGAPPEAGMAAGRDGARSSPVGDEQASRMGCGVPP